ncbi:MAG: AAA family ATPase [Deinococcota bacterium]|nr:AAA family ATPase [Allomeiothermus silvanus]MCL6568913.1 AAA family ATPase [Allomeiothermus silvanus]
MLRILRRRLFAIPDHTFPTAPLPSLCLMIGGVSGVGKSTLAERLAPKFKAHLESTDHLREALRTAYPAEFYPELHTHSHTAWKVLPQTQQAHPKVVHGLLAQARLLEKATQAVADRVAQEGRSLILEGVHLVPGRPIRPVYALSLTVLLVVRSPQEHLRRLKQRARATRRDPSAALTHFSQVRALQQALENRARLHHVPIVATDELDAEQALLALLKHRSLGVRP